LLASIGTGSLAHTLLVSVRRKHHELAVLKTIGFTRGQVAAAVASSATVLALVGVVIGAPLGAALGRAAWTAVAREVVGTEPSPHVPITAVLLIVAGAFVIANALAAWPAWAAARVRPAVALHVE
jgi:ABC-type antimicrobial peptide transport system permease subunit